MLTKNICHFLKTQIARNQRGGVGVVIFLAFAVLAVPAVIGANLVSDQIFNNFEVETSETISETDGAFDPGTDVDLTIDEFKELAGDELVVFDGK